MNIAGDDYLQDIDYNRIIRNAMKSTDSKSLNHNTEKSSKSIISNDKSDRDIIDVDAICKMEEGI